MSPLVMLGFYFFCAIFVLYIMLRNNAVLEHRQDINNKVFLHNSDCILKRQLENRVDLISMNKISYNKMVLKFWVWPLSKMIDFERDFIRKAINEK